MGQRVMVMGHESWDAGRRVTGLELVGHGLMVQRVHRLRSAVMGQRVIGHSSGGYKGEYVSK